MTAEITTAYTAWLLNQERSAATVEKYLRSVSAFFDWLGEERLGKEAVIRYKADLLGHSSINTTRIYLIETGKEHLRQLEAMRLVL